MGESCPNRFVRIMLIVFLIIPAVTLDGVEGVATPGVIWGVPGDAVKSLNNKSCLNFAWCSGDSNCFLSSSNLDNCSGEHSELLRSRTTLSEPVPRTGAELDLSRDESHVTSREGLLLFLLIRRSVKEDLKGVGERAGELPLGDTSPAASFSFIAEKDAIRVLMRPSVWVSWCCCAVLSVCVHLARHGPALARLLRLAIM